MKIISSLTRTALVGFHQGDFVGTPGAIEFASKKENTMDAIRSPLTISRTEVIRAVKEIRNQWEDAAQGNSLTQINGNVGYILFDVATALGLEGDDLTTALGNLADEAVENLG